MKCPGCQLSGDTSKVYINGTTKTLMGWRPYYDEDGNYHSHDPNRATTGYSCSNGHEWSITSTPSCPNTECSYGDEPTIAFRKQLQ